MSSIDIVSKIPSLNKRSAMLQCSGVPVEKFRVEMKDAVFGSSDSNRRYRVLKTDVLSYESVEI